MLTPDPLNTLRIASAHLPKGAEITIVLARPEPTVYYSHLGTEGTTTTQSARLDDHLAEAVRTIHAIDREYRRPLVDAEQHTLMSEPR